MGDAFALAIQPLGQRERALLSAAEEQPGASCAINVQRLLESRCTTSETNVAGARIMVQNFKWEWRKAAPKDVRMFGDIAATLGTREVSMLNMLMKSGKARGVAVRLSLYDPAPRYRPRSLTSPTTLSATPLSLPATGRRAALQERLPLVQRQRTRPLSQW